MSRRVHRLLAAAVGSALAMSGATIEGVVVERQTGRPMARARVSVLAIQGASAIQPPAFTDSAGRFALRQLGAGVYFLTADKHGYALAHYGQRRFNGPATPIALEKDSRFAVELRLARLGAISGKVVDENGFGLEDVPVFVYRDTKPLRLAGQGSTDDRGIFRVPRLDPGRYRVRTGPKELEDGTELLPTYVGDTVSAEASPPFEVRLDEETGEANIRPLPGRLLKLSGRVTFPGVSMVILYSDTGRNVTAPDRSGLFAFDQLSPGNIELLAESSKAGPMGYAKLYLSSDVEGLTLDGQPAPTVQFRCQDSEGQASGGRDFSLFVQRTFPPEEPRTQQLHCGGTATLSVGSWALSITTPAEFFVSQVLVQHKPADSNEVFIMPGQNVEIQAVVSSQVATLQGKVVGPGGQAAAGAWVLLRALDPAVQLHLYGKNSAKSDDNGEFTFKGLQPGRYQIMSLYEVQNAEEVDWNVPSLRTVELEEGKQTTSDLVLQSPPTD